MMLIAERTKPLLPARGAAWRKAWITEHLEGHYEFEEVPFGRVYRWCPGYPNEELPAYEEFSVGHKSYYFTPGGSLYQKERKTKEEASTNE